MVKFFVCIHVGYQTVLPDIYPHLEKIFRSKSMFELLFFVTYQCFSYKIKELREYLSTRCEHVKMIKVKKKGQDVGGFLIALIEIIENFFIEEEDILFCIHTKSKKQQLKILLDSLTDNVGNIMKIFSDNNVGMVGAKEYIYKLDYTNTQDLENICKKIGIKSDYIVDVFVAGKIFIMRACIFSKILKSEMIKEFYEELEDNYYTVNDKSTKIHSWERIFGIMTRHLGFKILGI